MSNHQNLADDLAEFYRLIDSLVSALGGMMCFRDLANDSALPKRGVYFIFEDGERRQHFSEKLRVTRVGTHAVSRNSKSSLAGRLKTHRGTLKGGGSHRSSVLRYHVGDALMNADSSLYLRSWHSDDVSRQSRERERDLERQVTSYIGDMCFLWLSVNDASSKLSDRAYIERNSIALLSNQEDAVDPPSESWLGNHSSYKEIRRSGLWNVRHIRKPYDPRFIDVFRSHVLLVSRKRDPGYRSLAPEDWHDDD